MNCVSCNTKVKEKFSPLAKCPNCNAEHQDCYYLYDHGIMIIDLILCKVEAYRHILINRNSNFSKSQIISSYGTLFLLYVLLELFYKYQANILPVEKSLPPPSFEEVLSSTQHIVLVLVLHMATVYLCAKQFFKNIKRAQLIPALILSHFARLSIVMFVIWKHKHFFKQMATLSIILSELTAIRAVCEQGFNWIASLSTLVLALVVQKILSDYVLEIPNITIL